MRLVLDGGFTRKSIKKITQKYEANIGPCVYFLLNRGKVIYIGQTTNLPLRLSDHKISKRYDETRYIILDQSKLSRVEEALIRAFKPRLNTAAVGPLRESDRFILKSLGLSDKDFLETAETHGDPIDIEYHGPVVIIKGEFKNKVGYLNGVKYWSECKEHAFGCGCNIKMLEAHVFLKPFLRNDHEVIKPNLVRKPAPWFFDKAEKYCRERILKGVTEEHRIIR